MFRIRYQNILWNDREQSQKIILILSPPQFDFESNPIYIILHINLMSIRHFLLGLLLLHSTVCWWQVGHMIVAKIAEDDLLASDPTSYEKFNNLIQGLNNFTDGLSNTFVEASVWPDDIKGYGATLFDNYHFLDRIYDPEGLMPIMSEVAKYNNSLNTIHWCTGVLKKNRDAVSFERAIMARFLLHIVGDIHQPLHSVQMFNSTKALINGDQGGNLVNITTTSGDAYNLHSFLDSIAAIVQKKNETTVTRPLDDVGNFYIRSLAKNFVATYPKDYFGSGVVNNLDVNTWTIESYNAAIKDIYSFVLKQNAATADWTTTIYELCKQRIALGGYRLSKMISSIYA